MILLKSTLLLFLTASALLATPQNKQKSLPADVIKMGERGSKQLTQTLEKQMNVKLKKLGTKKSMKFCADEAYRITKKVNKRLPKGVRVKRISSKYRSPANAPSKNELAVLESFQTLQNANIILPKQLIQQIDSKTYNYYKPIVIHNKTCLECHGTIKDVELRRAITSRYPLDSATNYKLGDLIGAFVVTVKRK